MNSMCENYESFLKDLENVKGGGKTKREFSSKVLQIFEKSGLTSLKYKNLNDKLLHTYFPEVYQPTSIALDIINHEIERNDGSSYRLSESLQQIGFEKTKADILEDLFVPFINNSFTYKQVLYKCIQYAFSPYKPIIPKQSYQHFFSQENITNKWVSYKKSKIYNINVTCAAQNKSIVEENVIKPIENKESLLFYHATDWRSAIAIMKAIQHEVGRDCLDFGYLPSFYCSNTIQHALDWGERYSKHKQNEIAIVMFQIPIRIDSHLQVVNLDKKNEWEQLVTKSRKCTPKPIRSEINELLHIDLVFGPMLKNPQDVIQGKKPLTHNPTRFQLASKTTNGDTFLQKYLVGSIIFQK